MLIVVWFKSVRIVRTAEHQHQICTPKAKNSKSQGHTARSNSFNFQFSCELIFE